MSAADTLKVILDDVGLDDAQLRAKIKTQLAALTDTKFSTPVAEVIACRELLDLLDRLRLPVRAIILQNRDRSTPAMIAQMNQIASAPDYYRVAPTKEFASGTPIVFGNDNALPADIAIGRRDKAVSADGQRFAVRYAVVEASDLLTSNKADGTAIDAYAGGAPGKLRAIAGNGRLAGLIAGFERGTNADYVRELSDDDAHGISADDIAQFKQPVLVRIMQQEDVTENIGDISNQRGTSDLSPVEQAQNDSKRLDLSELDIGDDGKPGESAALAFIAAMPESERNNLMDGKHPGQKAYDRLMASVFWKAYADPELVRLYAQSVDSEVKTILGGMASAAGDLAKLEGAGELDIRSVISEAAALAVNAKRQGVKLALFATQSDMTLSPDTMDVVRMFAENIRSAKKIGERLRAAARLAYEEFTKEGEDMFGVVEKAGRADVLKVLSAPDVALFDAIPPELAAELSDKLRAGLRELDAIGNSDPMATILACGKMQEVIRQWDEADAPSESSAVMPESGLAGDFGPIFNQYYHDAKGAIDRLIKEQDGDAVAALHHPQVGDIDLIWGKAGTSNSDGFGLAKLVIYHPEVLTDLQGFIDSLQKNDSKSGPNRIRLESKNRVASVRLDWEGSRKTWLMTAFEKRNSQDTRTDTALSNSEDDTARPTPVPVESVANTPDKVTRQSEMAAVEASVATIASPPVAAGAPAEATPLDPTTPQGYEALTTADESRLQDTLDAFFQGRLIDVRNALRDLGWDGEQSGELSKSGYKADFQFRQVGAGANVVGYHVRVMDGVDVQAEIGDDLSLTAIDVAAKIDAVVTNSGAVTKANYPAEPVPAPAINPKRATDEAFLRSVIAQNIDMWDDDLADKIEPLGEVYANDPAMYEAWSDAIKSYTDFMIEEMSKP